MHFRYKLHLICFSFLVIASAGVSQQAPHPKGKISTRAIALAAPKNPAPIITWAEQDTAVGLDGQGLIVSLQNKSDANHMEWVSPIGREWSLPVLRENGKLIPWNAPKVNFMVASPRSMDGLIFRHGDLSLDLNQSLFPDGTLEQSFRLHNDSAKTITLAEGDFGIRLPLPDNYPDASTALTRRADVHVWTGGGSSWIQAERMNGTPPHLGLLLTEGSLASYSITDRPWNSNDRGTFVVHPPAITLRPGEHYSFGWKLFWNTGWDDFFAHAMTNAGFVRLQADRYTVLPGQPIHITAEASPTPRNLSPEGQRLVSTAGSPLEGARLTVNGRPIPATVSGTKLEASFTPTTLGDQLFDLAVTDQHTRLRAFASPDPLTLIEARVRFLIEHQQKNAPGQAVDGAFLAYDNETHQQILEKTNDHNAGRERVGMGVLLALYLPHVQDPSLRAEITRSLDRYLNFVTNHLQDASGKVFNDTDDPRQRLYNYPWVARLHLAMYGATSDPRYLEAFARTIRAFYANGGDRFYAIDLPITDGLAAEAAAGRTTERDELLTLFRAHADRLISVGLDMPRSEVNYEQSIVAPACSILLETFLVTHEKKYLDAAQPFLAALFAFNGHQPDAHLNDIAIRHWDDFWFGKAKLYGDTFPHYWSTLTALVLEDLAQTDVAHATEDRDRAAQIIANNLSLFHADGSASDAYVYPLTVNDHPGRFYDPWANDQDWALVHWLLLHPSDASPQTIR
jgi:hypothetical protein